MFSGNGDCTTDDDISVFKMGKFWPKSERKVHSQAAKQRKEKGRENVLEKSTKIEESTKHQVEGFVDDLDEEEAQATNPSKEVVLTVMTV